MTATTVKEFVIALENKPGTLAEVTSALGGANVNITGLVCEAQGEFGIVRLVTSDPAKTEGWLRTTNHRFRTNDVLAVNVPNNAGELGKIAKKLAASGVNINSTFLNLPPTGTPQLVFSVSDINSAKKVIG
ncbi:MAG: ACT domain-containing protein [Thermoplasmatota archaeon]